jgi:hypothetical protein
LDFGFWIEGQPPSGFPLYRKKEERGLRKRSAGALSIQNSRFKIPDAKFEIQNAIQEIKSKVED